jgi:predicted  nucleic acid-binding Zn-ribbon protein
VTDDSLSRVEELYARLQAARAKLEATDDPESAIDVVAELSEISKQVEEEIARIRRDVEPDADA